MVPLVFLVDNKGIVAWLQVVGELPSGTHFAAV